MKIIVLFIAFTSTAFAGSKTASFGLDQPAKSLVTMLGQQLSWSRSTARAALDKVLGKSDISVGTHLLYYSTNSDGERKLLVGRVDTIYREGREFGLTNGDGTSMLVRRKAVVDIATYPDQYEGKHAVPLDRTTADLTTGFTRGAVVMKFNKSGYYLALLHDSSEGDLALVSKRDFHFIPIRETTRVVRVGWRNSIKLEEPYNAIDYDSVPTYLRVRDKLSPEFYVGLTVHYRKSRFGKDHFGKVIDSTPGLLKILDGDTWVSTFIPFSQLQGVAIADHPHSFTGFGNDVMFLEQHAYRSIDKSPLASLRPDANYGEYVRGGLDSIYTSGVALVTLLKNDKVDYYVVASKNLKDRP